MIILKSNGGIPETGKHLDSITNKASIGRVAMSKMYILVCLQ